MVDKRSADSRPNKGFTGLRINMDLPVGLAITVPSAENPATPPKGQGQGAAKGSSIEQGGNRSS